MWSIASLAALDSLTDDERTALLTTDTLLSLGDVHAAISHVIAREVMRPDPYSWQLGSSETR